MSNVLMLWACLVAGVVLRRRGRVPADAHVAVNAVVVHVSLPAMTLHHLHGMPLHAGQLWPVLVPWALFALGAVLFRAVGRALALPRPSVGALTLVAGLGNTSFIGLPVIESLVGQGGLGLGVLISQLGTHLALSTLGVIAATVYSCEGPVAARVVLRRVMTFPPFIAVLVSLVSLPVNVPPVLDAALARIADTLSPLALISVGLQLRLDALREHAGLVGLGLAYKLLVCPAVVLAPLLLGGGAGMAGSVSLIEAAMPPMVSAGIVAAQARLAPALVSTLIGVGVPLGMLTAVMWYRVLLWATA